MCGFTSTLCRFSWWPTWGRISVQSHGKVFGPQPSLSNSVKVGMMTMADGCGCDVQLLGHATRPSLQSCGKQPGHDVNLVARGSSLGSGTPGATDMKSRQGFRVSPHASLVELSLIRIKRSSGPTYTDVIQCGLHGTSTRMFPFWL